MDYFGNKKLKDITRPVINYFFTSHKKEIHGEMKPLSHGNAKKLYGILQSLFSFAVSQGYIMETPCRNIILPPKPIMEQEKRNYLTPEELPEFLSFFEGYSPFHTIILVLLFTGMRAGECLGLTWSDIDFEHKKIYIHHTLTDVGGKHFLTTPKTNTSIRCQYMSERLVQILSKHRTEQKKLQLSLGADFIHPEMVFTSGTGNYKDRSSLHASFKRCLKGTKFEFMTLHKLRHTNATLLLNHGVDLKIVSEHLGHSDVSVTGDIYTDVLDRSRVKTAITMERILGGEGGRGKVN
jgi:integrase